jgi:hypothetical protein
MNDLVRVCAAPKTWGFGGWVWTPISLENEQAKARGSREGIMYIEGRNYFEGRGKINRLELDK